MNVNFSPSSFPGQFFLKNKLENVIFTPKLFGLVNHPISVPRHVVFTIIFCSFPQNLYRFVRTLHSESHNFSLRFETWEYFEKNYDSELRVRKNRHRTLRKKQILFNDYSIQTTNNFRESIAIKFSNPS